MRCTTDRLEEDDDAEGEAEVLHALSCTVKCSVSPSLTKLFPHTTAPMEKSLAFFESEKEYWASSRRHT